MEHRRIGKSAIYVSDICMGTMTFGSQTHEAEAHRILDRCLDAGINFFDTAEGYPVPPDIKWVGRTEDIVGRWMKGKNRDAIIMATKVSGPSHTWFKSPKRGGMTTLDRHNIITAVEESLRRLQTDYIDLYQTHWPDHGLAYDETMEVLDELVRSGKVRVLGCSNETSYGLMKSLATSERLGVARYESIQNNFSINNRRFEDELKQVCRQEGIPFCLIRPWVAVYCPANISTAPAPKARVSHAISKWPDRAKSKWRSVLPGHAHLKARCGLSRLRKRRACRQ
jgi:aryl-alcohol dehydrogenase-like predicted oxidoreductase